MIVVRVSYEHQKELETIMDKLKGIAEIRKVKRSDKVDGHFRKAYITLELKENCML